MSDKIRDSKPKNKDSNIEVEEEEVPLWENDTEEYVLAVSGGAFT